MVSVTMEKMVSAADEPQIQKMVSAADELSPKVSDEPQGFRKESENNTEAES